MATRNVVFNEGSGPDERALGGHILVSRHAPGPAGDTYVHATPGKVLITDPPTGKLLEVGIAYKFDPVSPDGVVKYGIIQSGAGDLLYKDIVPVDPLTLDPILEPEAAWWVAHEATDDAVVAHLADTVDAHDATALSNVPAGGIAATTVQAALNELDTEKAPKASPTFTGTVSGVTKTHVGLGSVDNTPDADKPVSTAQAAAIALKQNAVKIATAVLDFGSIAAGAQASLTIAVTGVFGLEAVNVSPSTNIEAGLTWVGYVSASHTVTVRVTNTTLVPIDPVSASWRATVI